MRSLLPLALWWSAVSVPVAAQTFTVLYTFDSVSYANGSEPVGTLAVDGNGVLYGVTAQGGAYTNCFDGPGSGCGTVYSLAPPASPGGAWTETVLWSFGAGANDGSSPNGIAIGRDGVLYGTTTYGGQAVGGGCCGTVFSLKRPSTPGGTWTEAIIWSFSANDGVVYPSGLAIDSNGALYGTDTNGGPRHHGDVYALDPPSSPGGGWRHTELWVAGSDRDGLGPEAGVAIGAGHVLYATAYGGGTGGRGLVFALAPPAQPGGLWTETVLYNFPEAATQHPMALSFGADGVLYGTTVLSHKDMQGGTIFSLAPPASQGGSWGEATLWQFPTISRNAATSDEPAGPLLIQPQTGALFGATGSGYVPGSGTLFELVPPGSGGSEWSKLLLSPAASLWVPTVGLMSGGVIYGADAGYNTVWSVVP
jgi:hypothetical protein